LQRHVNLAIAYNVWQYIWATEDQQFLDQHGARLFLEICRFWSSKASYNEEKKDYEIERVMGPDEFHEKYPDATDGGLDNNSYTNIMVAWVLKRAFDLLDRMSAEARESLKEAMRLSNEEIVRWEAIASNLFVPLSDDGIIEQFEGYFDLKELDWEHYQHKYDDIHRMDRILKAEDKSPDAYKVAKQADALMTFYLLKEDEVVAILNDLGYDVPDDLLRENFYYYLNRTSHGSTLSRLVHAYLANEIGDWDLSWKLYTEALKSDYIDIQGGTTEEGIHTGAMTGTVLFALRAYAGIDFGGESLKVNPNLPGIWRQMRFNVGFKGGRYHFVVTKKQVEMMLADGAPTDVYVRGDKITLTPGEWIVVEVA
jgi:trehalose/maltose hydrolase-like predicted phosphorylase